MDSKDFQLLVGLYADARQSLLSLGRRVSLSAPAVRDRLRRLESKGILQGFVLYPDPSIFSRDDLIVFFDGEYTRQDAMRVLKAPDVARVGWKVDGGLSVQVWPHNRAQAMAELAAVLRGATPSWNVFTERREIRPLSLLDLTIVDALIDDPRLPLKDLTTLTGLSPKTARKHLELLVRDRAISLRPRLGALTDTGELVYQLLVFGKVGMGELRRTLGDVVLVTQMQEPPAKYLLCRGSDLTEVTAKNLAVEKLPGVESITITLNRELLVATEFVHALVREKIQHLERTRDGRSR